MVRVLGSTGNANGRDFDTKGNNSGNDSFQTYDVETLETADIKQRNLAIYIFILSGYVRIFMR